MSAGGTVGGLQRRCRHTQHYPCWYGHDIERLWAAWVRGDLEPVRRFDHLAASRIGTVAWRLNAIGYRNAAHGRWVSCITDAKHLKKIDSVTRDAMSAASILCGSLSLLPSGSLERIAPSSILTTRGVDRILVRKECAARRHTHCSNAARINARADRGRCRITAEANGGGQRG